MEQAADPNKEAVYEWEDDWYDWSSNTCSLKECRRLILWACKAYGVDPPVVKQHHKRTYSWSMPAAGVISLQAKGAKPGRGGKNPATALHEAAHHIVYAIFSDRPQDHGPTFLGIYMWLLTEARVAPEVALHSSARARNLKWRILPPHHPRIRARPSSVR